MIKELPYSLGEFTQGAMYYFDHYTTDDLVRLVLNIYLANQQKPISAIVDTGAPWCVLKPALLEKIESRIEPIRPLDRPLYIRGTAYVGWLYHVPIRLEAIFGESLEVGATALIPELPPDEEWLYPNFIGLDGFLNRIRFAVDPASNLFFFGELV